MQNRLPFLVLLASALTFLASLFLPWQELQSPTGETGVLGVLNLFASGGSVEGWGTTAGVAASLAALVLAAVAAAALIRQTAAIRARFTPIALALLYLAIGSVLVMRAEERAYGRRLHLHFHYAYGMFLGLAVAALALVGAVVLEASEIRRPRPIALLTALLGVGLLASALLPWVSPLGPDRTISFPGVILGLVVLLAAWTCVIVGMAPWAGPTRSAAFAVAVLAGAGLNAIWPNTIRYGAWIALGFAIALVVTAAAAEPRWRPLRPPFAPGVGAAAAAVLVVSLFLPWQQFCNPGGHPYGHGIGSCVDTTGWATGEFGASTGVLALILIFGALAATRLAFPPTEIVLAIATLVAVTGALLGKSSGYPSWSFGYGAYVGFAATGILLFLALSRVPPPRIESRHALARLVSLAAAFAAFLTIALPLWSVLPDRWSSQAVVLEDWYAVVGLLLTIHLLRRWLESARRIPFPSDQLVVLPLALLALTALELVRKRGEGMTWGGGILVGLCLLLALLGWMEPNGRLESFRVPEEFWRIDRLPGKS